MDVVKEYIELKKQLKNDSERLEALEKLVLTEHRDDDRIKILPGRETIEISDEAYERLSVFVEIEVVEKRRKKLKEFDVDIQQVILSNENNIIRKVTKEIVKVKD